MWQAIKRCVQSCNLFFRQTGAASSVDANLLGLSMIASRKGSGPRLMRLQVLSSRQCLSFGFLQRKRRLTKPDHESDIQQEGVR